MNMLPSLCNSCGVDILVSQAQWADPFAHVCVKCQTEIFAGLTEEEEEEFDEAFDHLMKHGWVTFDEDGNPLFDEELGAEDFLDEELIDNEFEGLEPDEPKCECGAEKANTPHARWCPLYE